ncbi:hypothetical protein HYH02_005995 [Chlamydomonas schloesseri]|uniref:Uncharacterized protein n=1 Tax=Chlamydomonas schloesseri TaxID=2026947 RepID=A0A835WKA2_9CHLO|nr:hypothetical protein HYH02_005995 [Chlamydomonas schloesseri]|eukprot:KAG2449249.1 hypothetical protein HYH02_005995 [Chlamydomonas schloesseri]
MIAPQSVDPTADAVDGASPHRPLAPVPPYSSFIRYRTWFAKFPGYHPSQLTPGWQERLRLLVAALNGGDDGGGEPAAGEPRQQQEEPSHAAHGPLRGHGDATALAAAAVAARASSTQGQHLRVRGRTAASQGPGACSAACGGSAGCVRVAGMYVREGCIELLLEEEVEDWQREWEWGSGLSTESEEGVQALQGAETPAPALQRLLLLPQEAEMQLVAAAASDRASDRPPALQGGAQQQARAVAGAHASTCTTDTGGSGLVAAVVGAGAGAGAGAACDESAADGSSAELDISRWLAAAVAAAAGGQSGGNSSNTHCSNGSADHSASETGVPRRLLAGTLPDNTVTEPAGVAPIVASPIDDTYPGDTYLDRRLPAAQPQPQALARVQALSVHALAQRGRTPELAQEPEPERPFVLRGHVVGSGSGDADRMRTLVTVGFTRAAGADGSGAGGGAGEPVVDEDELIAVIVAALVEQRNEGDRRRREQERQLHERQQPQQQEQEHGQGRRLEQQAARQPPAPAATAATAPGRVVRAAAPAAAAAAETVDEGERARAVVPPPRVPPAVAPTLLAGCPLGAVTVGPRVLLVPPPPLPSLLAAQLQQSSVAEGGGLPPPSGLGPESATDSAVPPLLPLPRSRGVSPRSRHQRLRLTCYPVSRRLATTTAGAAADAADGVSDSPTTALAPTAAGSTHIDTGQLQVHVRSRGAYLRSSVAWQQQAPVRGGEAVAAAVAASERRVWRPQVAALELQEPHLQPGVAMLDVRWRGVPCAAVPLVLTSDPELARELAVAAAAWPRSADELDALLLDFGTWEFYVADMSAMAAALAEAAAAAMEAAAEARAPLPRLPPPAPLVVTLGRHLLGYATVAGWRRVAARLRADLSWMGLGEVARGVPEVPEAPQEPGAAGQQQATVTASAAAAAPAPPVSSTAGTGGDVSPGVDTAAGGLHSASEAASGTPADSRGSGSGSKQGLLDCSELLCHAGEDAGAVTVTAGATLCGPMSCGLGSCAAAGGGGGVNPGAGSSSRSSSSGSRAGEWGGSGKCEGRRKGAPDPGAQDKGGTHDDVKDHLQFADAVAMQQGHMRYFDLACMVLLGLRTLAQAASAAGSSGSGSGTSSSGAPPPPPSPHSAGWVLLVLAVSTFAGVLSTLARPMLSAPAWAALERRCRLLRYYCYAVAKAMVFAGLGWPPGVSAYLLTPGMLLLEGAMVQPREGLVALLVMNTASFAQIAQKLSRERNAAAAAAEREASPLFGVFADREAVASAALIAGRTLLLGVATNLLFNAYVRRLYARRHADAAAHRRTGTGAGSMASAKEYDSGGSGGGGGRQAAHVTVSSQATR